MPVGTLLAVGAGAASALLYATLLTGTLGAYMLAYLAQLPLFLVGLSLGTNATLVAALSAAILCAAVGSMMFGVVFGIVNAAPAVVITRQALLNRPGADGRTEWYPAGSLVAWATGMAAAALLAVVVVFGTAEGGLEATIRGFVEEALKRFIDVASAPGGDLAPTAAVIARFFPGAVAGSWLLMTAANFALAQAMLQRAGKALRPAPAMAKLDLPGWILPATGIAAAGTLMPGASGFVGVNLLVIFGVAYVFAGLAVIHAIARHWGNRLLGLVAIYLFIFIFGWPIMVIGFLGLIEPWARLRDRFGGPRAS